MRTQLRQLAAAAVCAAGLGLVAAAPAAAEEFSRDEIETIIYEYLMENPSVILEAVNRMQERQQAEEAERQRQNLVGLRDDIIDGASTVVAGNPDGDVTLVEFFDYRCTYCKRVAPAMMTLVEEDPGLRLAMMEFPILGDESVYAARASLAAARQDLYWEMHSAMIEFNGSFNEGTIRAIAADVGLDADRLIADMSAPEIQDIINRNYEIAQALGINGTPAFIVGDTIVPGAISLEALKDLVDTERNG